MIMHAADNLSTLNRQRKQFEAALDHYTVYKQYSDSLFNESNVKKITELEMQHQFDTRMKDEELKRQVEVQKRKRQ
jgi:hypothetical protein